MMTDIPTQEQRLVYNGIELSNDNKTINEYDIMNESTVQLLLRLSGGRLQGQVLQKSLLYLRPRGYMGINDEKLHCLMMAKLVNTRQIHLLTLVKYFYGMLFICCMNMQICHLPIDSTNGHISSTSDSKSVSFQKI